MECHTSFSLETSVGYGCETASLYLVVGFLIFWNYKLLVECVSIWSGTFCGVDFLIFSHGIEICVGNEIYDATVLHYGLSIWAWPQQVTWIGFYGAEI